MMLNITDFSNNNNNNNYRFLSILIKQKKKLNNISSNQKSSIDRIFENKFYKYSFSEGKMFLILMILNIECLQIK